MEQILTIQKPSCRVLFLCMSNPIPTRFLTPIDCSRIQAQISLIVLIVCGEENAVPSDGILIANI